MSPTQAQQIQAERKSTIGQRKGGAKKVGLGAKKGGLGAQKVKKDFAEIEREAEMADQMKVRMEQERKVNEAQRVEDEAIAAANMKLAYQDISAKTKKAEEQMRKMDSKKADQFERLGMGAVGAKKAGISHSAMSDAIVQEEPLASSNKRFGSRRNDVMDDDFEVLDNDWRSGGGFGRSRGRDMDDDGFDGFGGGGGSKSSDWEKEFEVMKLESSARNTESDWIKAFDDEPRSRPHPRPDTYAPAAPVDLQKKFGSAKAISSDMVFDNKDSVSFSKN